MTHEPSSHRFYYGWVVVAVTALTLLVSAGVRSAPGVFLVPLQEDTQWSIGVISFAVSIGLLVLGLTAPVSGWFIDRYGPRRLAIIALVLISISMAASAFIQEPWQLALLWGGLSGVGTGIISGVLGATVAMRWFVARRGLVIGMFGASTSAGQLIFVPALMLAATTLGWRASSLALSLVAMVAVLPVLLFLRNDPADVGQVPFGATPATTAPRAGAESGVMRRAVRSPVFWLLAGTFFICGATSNGLVGTHLIPFAHDHGISQTTAAGMLALMGAMNFVGTLGSGWLTDRYDPRKLLAIYYGFRGLSLLFLPFVTEPVGLAAFAVLFGLDYIATVPPTTALVADNFGRRNVGTVYGWVFCSHQVGAALAAWMGGLARDSFGDYGLAFLLAGTLAVAGALLALRISRTPMLAATPSQP
ncbi:MAG: MFS transporter [Caldilinea sp.]|nr:MFS transporter [Caldilinea sp.]MCB0058569.1 MFS transporter [Caldilineaceae bacterium]MCB0038412.1 MFS transporter [Caldilinea sp.]MCB9115651.1 MFS transporter [Caldilineaceae bacterium]MCB9121137.1 MFS transporter [Caldilineaceae bacterium]